MSGHDSQGSNKVVCPVWCMVFNVVDDDDDGDDDDDDDDDDVAIACKESRPQRMLLSSRPYFFYQIGICLKLGVSNP